MPWQSLKRVTSEIPGQSGHALPVLLPPVWATTGHDLSAARSEERVASAIPAHGRSQPAQRGDWVFGQATRRDAMSGKPGSVN